MDKELLQIKFDSLTRELKEMDSSDISYQRVWDERAEISRQLALINQTPNKSNN